MKPLTRNTVLKAAMRVCDLWSDGEVARKAMRADIAAIPDDQLADLYGHFVSAYSPFKGTPPGYLRKIERASSCLILAK